MIKKSGQKLTLYRPSTYQIKVPGELGDSWSDWNRTITIEIDCEDDGSAFSLLTGIFDQAAMQSVLRRLYSLGLPLRSVIWIEQ